MKSMTCKELDGVCDEVIRGETPEEMIKNSQEHAMSADDDAHKDKMKQMGEMSTDPESVKKYMEDFKTKFDALPEYTN